MTNKQLHQFVKRYHGWFEDGVIRFPSVYLKEQFEKAIANV